MKNLLKTYIISLLGPITLLKAERYNEFFISLCVLSAVIISYFFLNDAAILRFLFLLYVLFSTCLTYHTIIDTGQDRKYNLSNALISFLLNCLFGCGLFAIFTLSKINIFSQMDLSIQVTIMFFINLLIIYVNSSPKVGAES